MATQRNTTESRGEFVTDAELGGSYTTANVGGQNVRQSMIKVSLEGTSDQVREYYNEISGFYDEYCESVGKECGAQNMAKIVESVQPSKNARILDVACGNGILGEQLKTLGYMNVDGLDFAQKMIDLTKSKGVFTNYICASIDPDKKTPVPDNAYDVVCMNGSMGVGLVSPKCLPELTRMAKPGGVVIFNITAYWVKTVADFGDEAMAANLRALVRDGLWTKWIREEHVYYKTTGEKAVGYIGTVAR
ncbi:methyltransferase-like protein 27 [Amphiura filiformis]|uniref:methyltransferase-like protein 27 n=1 Tax=Amphiura filiformis TaxID=82378 RepID=UPI003B20DE1E